MMYEFRLALSDKNPTAPPRLQVLWREQSAKIWRNVPFVVVSEAEYRGVADDFDGAVALAPKLSRSLVDCGECATQGCLEGSCRRKVAR